jgi:hypothetical protein
MHAVESPLAVTNAKALAISISKLQPHQSSRGGIEQTRHQNSMRYFAIIDYTHEILKIYMSRQDLIFVPQPRATFPGEGSSTKTIMQ